MSKHRTRSSTPSTRSCPVSDISFNVQVDDSDRVFGTIRDALVKDGVDPYDRDAFLMHRSVVETIHGARPTGEVGAAIDEFTALMHLMFLFWLDGQEVFVLDDASLGAVMSGQAGSGRSHGRTVRRCVFIGIGTRRIWGSPTEAGPEPLDGWYAARRGDRLMVAAQFGGRPDRDGATIVAVEGPEPIGLVREDGTALFAPTLPGGARAGLYSLTGMEELLALAWRVEHWRAEKA